MHASKFAFRPWLWVVAVALAALISRVDADGAEQPPRRVVRLAAQTDLASLDPTTGDSSTEALAIGCLFDQVLVFHPFKRPQVLAPGLASEMPTVSEDGKTYTFNLRKDATFVDDACFPKGKGRAVTAHDVVFSWLRLMDAQSKSYGTWVFGRRVEGIDAFHEASKKISHDGTRDHYSSSEGYPAVPGLKVIDAHTFQIRLVEPDRDILSLVTSAYASVIAPEAAKKYGKDLAKHPVPSGPYRVVSFRPSRRLSLARRLQWRDQRYPSEGALRDSADGILADQGKSLPRNAGVEIKQFDTEAAAWSAFVAGELDLAPVPRDMMAANIDERTLRPLPVHTAKGRTLHREPVPEIHYDVFNMDDPVLGSPAGEKGAAIRRAICLALDDHWFVSYYYRSLAEPLQGSVLPEFDEFEQTWQHPWRRRSDESQDDAKDLARDELEEAGFEGGKGIPELVFTTIPGVSYDAAFDRMKKDLADIGITIRKESIPWKDLRARLDEGRYQMSSSSWRADWPDVLNFLQLFHGGRIPEPNWSRLKNDDFDDLFERARRLPPGDDREILCHRMRDLIADLCPWRVRFRRVNFTMTQPWLENYRYAPIEPRILPYLSVEKRPTR